MGGEHGEADRERGGVSCVCDQTSLPRDKAWIAESRL